MSLYWDDIRNISFATPRLHSLSNLATRRRIMNTAQLYNSSQALPIQTNSTNIYILQTAQLIPFNPSHLTTMLKLINIIPQNLHLHLLQIILILRRIHRPIRLIALKIRPPIIAPRPAAALPTATAHAQEEQDHEHAASDCNADDGGFGKIYFGGAGLDA
jgi:hypothetical protein